MLAKYKTRCMLCALLSLAFMGGPLDGEERNVGNPFADETYDGGLLPSETRDIIDLFKRMETLPEPVPAFEVNSFLRDSNRLIGQMEDFRSDVMSRSSELNDKFDELEKLLREHPTCLVEGATPPVADKPPEPTPAPLPSAVAADADAAESTLPTDPNESSVITQPVAIDREPSIWEEESTLDTIAVLDSVVNQLALANNLYAAGETKIALKMYQKLRQDSTGDQAWVTYQIAQCHRVLGSKSNSDQAFRIVTAMPNTGRWSEYSKWWLANDESVATLGQQSDQLSTALEELRKQLNESENK